ncbi:MAG: hypothetical protein CMP10_02005 [Zetaproteobacteria bacterium]|nr:hypothetical protein [Pseudobdellovibrionaceae bacterium]
MRQNYSIIMIFSLMVIFGCDPERREKCEWYLMPDKERRGQTEENMIPVCARNLKSSKEDCRLQTTLKFAEHAWNRKFRYIDLKVESYGNPRSISQIEFCEPPNKPQKSAK